MIVPSTTSDRVFFALREQILLGDLKPGMRLVQRKLAAEFGTSNIPIVEAIRRLERDGLVVSHPRWGAEVNSWNLNDIQAYYNMREGLEAVTSRLFAENASKSEKSALVQFNETYEAARALGAREASEADLALHLHIVQCAGSDNLYRLAEQSCVITATVGIHLYTMDRAGLHDDLVAALCSGDPVEAERAARAHIREALQRLLDVMAKQQENVLQ